MSRRVEQNNYAMYWGGRFGRCFCILSLHRAARPVRGVQPVVAEWAIAAPLHRDGCMPHGSIICLPIVLWRRRQCKHGRELRPVTTTGWTVRSYPCHDCCFSSTVCNIPYIGGMIRKRVQRYWPSLHSVTYSVLYALSYQNFCMCMPDRVRNPRLPVV